MKYYLIAGEASGDLHASNLMKALKRKDTAAEFRFFGGDMMKAVGGELVRHYRDMAFMGVIPVLMNLRKVLSNLSVCRRDVVSFHPDALILIDYPGFNLKIARYVKEQMPDIKVFYYISPKIWAWKKYRIKAIRRYVDRMMCILPFEKEFYAGLGYNVDYVGNPCVDSVSAFLESVKDKPDNFLFNNKLSEKPVLAILPGSRKAEIAQNLPVMLSVVAQYPEYQVVIAGAPGLTADDYSDVATKSPAVIFGQTYNILRHSAVALVTSGTATLETALLRVPQIVCYYITGGRFSSFVFRTFFHTPFISLVNLIAGREVVKELYGGDFTVGKVYCELKRIIEDADYRHRMMDGYDEVIGRAGLPGASERAAGLIIDCFVPRNDVIPLSSLQTPSPSSFFPQAKKKKRTPPSSSLRTPPSSSLRTNVKQSINIQNDEQDK
ncbi:MAG: lipid-A-disaccharide synthase [Tannerella sp.]|jgi:lipid-A-disaccharide synthase|nr:lipid-A-disaccharide synthase [Tannerella sp.]